jgi:hypothetical protein
VDDLPQEWAWTSREHCRVYCLEDFFFKKKRLLALHGGFVQSSLRCKQAGVVHTCPCEEHVFGDVGLRTKGIRKVALEIVRIKM